MPFFSGLAQAPHSAIRAFTRARSTLLGQVRAASAEPDERFPGAFARLTREVEAALRHEEIVMETVAFPGLREQRRENALLLNALHHAQPRVEAGDLALGREVVHALADLLSLHRFSGLRLLASVRRAGRVLRRGSPADRRARRGGRRVGLRCRQRPRAG